ncbi:MAG: response regulator transcription factor [Methylotenera sp.]|nr:response regulator transcription factor [Oligoflexia bacterium]
MTTTELKLSFKAALLVEDEHHLAETLKIAIKRMGIPCSHVKNLQDARLHLAKAEKPDLVILDRQLPDGDGITLCASLRKQGYAGTILMLTARGETAERVKGLNAGADDYLPKPFAWEELSARLLALSRRVALRPRANVPLPGTAESAEAAVAWERDEKRLRIQGPKGWMQLTPLEYKLAAHLIEAQGEIVSRDELLKEVWGFTLLPKTRTVDHFLGRLRKMFEQDPDQPAHFVTVRGAGYRFISTPGSSSQG